MHYTPYIVSTSVFTPYIRYTVFPAFNTVQMAWVAGVGGAGVGVVGVGVGFTVGAGDGACSHPQRRCSLVPLVEQLQPPPKHG